MASGGCQCGKVRYRFEGEPETVYVCHCRECRRQSASAFGISVIVPTRAITLTAGTPKIWRRPTDSGDRLDCYFCPDCGSRLWHVSVSDPALSSVKGGSLDTPPDLSEAAHIWTSRKLPGIEIPEGVLRFTGEPDTALPPPGLSRG